MNVYEPNVAIYTGTENLYERMIPAMKSLICNSSVDKIILGLEHDEFPLELPDKARDMIEVINLSGQKYFGPDGPNWGSVFTYMAMIRGAFADMFPQYKRILSMDVDTFVNKDISDIWDLPLGDKYYFAAAKEPKKSLEHNQLYCNIGVCLYNLEKLRDGTWQKVVDLINNRKMFLVEQDAFNFTCKGKILEMPGEYNAFFATRPTGYAKVVHFASVRDWTEEDLYKKWCKISWDEVFRYRLRIYNK